MHKILLLFGQQKICLTLVNGHQMGDKSLKRRVCPTYCVQRESVWKTTKNGSIKQILSSVEMLLSYQFVIDINRDNK